MGEEENVAPLPAPPAPAAKVDRGSSDKEVSPGHPRGPFQSDCDPSRVQTDFLSSALSLANDIPFSPQNNLEKKYIEFLQRFQRQMQLLKETLREEG